MKIIVYLLFFFLSVSAFSQSVKKIVRRMESIPEVQFIGQFGDFPNYTNYKALKSKATVAELLDLLNHKNAVVACYSSLALLENEYGDLNTYSTN